MKKMFFLAFLLLPLFILPGRANGEDPCLGCWEPGWADRLLHDTDSREYWCKRLGKAREALSMTGYDHAKAVAYWGKVESDPRASAAVKKEAKEILNNAGDLYEGALNCWYCILEQIKRIDDSK